MSERQKIWVFVGVCFGLVAAMFAFVPPIPQDLAYHHFSDRRGWLGVPNFGDVMSNAPFLLAGLYGLWVLSKRRAEPARAPLVVFFVVIILVGPASAYYHWTPDNWTLFWDRLPMTVAFMALTAAVIADRIDARVGVRYALPLLILVGVASALYWRQTEAVGAGDLRAYALVQFLPMVAIPLMGWLFPKFATIGWRAIGAAFVFYGLAKVTEHFDHQIMELLGGAMSGHTLKHLFAAIGLAVFAYALKPQDLAGSSSS